MPVLVTCKFDGDWSYSNGEKVETSFFSIKSLWEKFPHSRANKSKVTNAIRPNFELI